MKKMCMVIVLIMLPMITLTGCKPYKKWLIRESWVIGKTSIVIEENFGEFDCDDEEPDEDGMYRNCWCRYLIKESKTKWYGTTPDLFFYIYFNENGIAERCYYEEFGD